MKTYKRLEMPLRNPRTEVTVNKLIVHQLVKKIRRILRNPNGNGGIQENSSPIPILRFTISYPIPYNQLSYYPPIHASVFKLSPSSSLTKTFKTTSFAPMHARGLE